MSFAFNRGGRGWTDKKYVWTNFNSPSEGVGWIVQKKKNIHPWHDSIMIQEKIQCWNSSGIWPLYSTQLVSTQGKKSWKWDRSRQFYKTFTNIRSLAEWWTIWTRWSLKHRICLSFASTANSLRTIFKCAWNFQLRYVQSASSVECPLSPTM